ncbi:TIGR03915 family putative DNA repair protein [Miniphocaeibacter halophilus]|uniref:TIGR03915 family putative DNA repair protein n=1 Tax=Miniphocaeibacter halophilus TaxID=2931922 RepID=A0AC61N3T6_9FIRM|nr:TIGR03915 family putative DNA repair protein [Miniphocaeibacter halophilus]QQK08996.1 TIGR03915 family putative DNA repair protein [Miniphocaeibacter halophilus]
MIYLYDNSLMGFLTCIYYGYKNYKDLENIQENNIQMNIFSKYKYIESEEEKSNIIIDYLSSNFNKDLINSIYNVFLSNSMEKEMTILNTIILARKYGNRVLNVPNNNIFRFNRIERNVLFEKHRFEGLLRFSEIQNGFLYAPFEPENNILPLLIGHFVNRLQNQQFLIHDVKRNYVAIYEKNNLDFFDVEKLNIEYSEDEIKYQNLWNIFFKSISIKERKNLKQQVSFMPKKYWKYLIEKK